jgi:hypothetical protein
VPARFDKYDPVSGGTRARLAADWLDADVGVVRGVALDANGRAIKNTTVTNGKGVIALGKKRLAGEPIDIMTYGEIVDVTGLVAGTDYYLAANGTITTVGPAAGVNGIYVGFTVEADRLVVRVQKVQG